MLSVFNTNFWSTCHVKNPDLGAGVAVDLGVEGIIDIERVPHSPDGGWGSCTQQTREGSSPGGWVVGWGGNGGLREDGLGPVWTQEG